MKIFNLRQPGTIDASSVILAVLFSSLTVFLTAPLLTNQTIHIPWANWQYLDQSFLRNAPSEALVCLHSQPPLLNAIASFILTTSSVLKIDEVVVETFVILLTSGIGFYCADRLLASSQLPLVFRIFILFLFSITPSNLYFSTELFYTYLIMNLLLVAGWSFYQFVRTGSGFRFGVLSGALLLIVWMRSSYPPIWGSTIIVLAVLFAFRAGVISGAPRAMRFVAFALVAIAATWLWPIKNLATFGHFTNTSWEAFNLSRDTDEASLPGLLEFMYTGTVREGLGLAVERYAAPCNKSLSVLSVNRPGLSFDPSNQESAKHARNYNHFIFLEAWPNKLGELILWRVNHLDAWMRTAARNYRISSQPSFVHPYSFLIPIGAEAEGYRYFAKVKEVFFLPVLGSDVAEFFSLSLFGILFPLVLIGSIAVSLPRSRDPWSLTVVFLVVLVLSNYVVPILTDGREANRMTFESSGVFMILVANLVVAFPLRRYRNVS